MHQFNRLETPFFHLAAVDKTEISKLLQNIRDTSESSSILRIVEGGKCRTLDSLFAEFAKEFEFPDYFGYNWPALDECLNDLEWLQGDSYILIFKDIDQIMTSADINFQVLAEILVQTVNEWTAGRNYDDFPTPPTPFHVIFTCTKENESSVKTILEEAGIGKITAIDMDKY